MRIKTAATAMLSFACGVLVCILVGVVLFPVRPSRRTDVTPEHSRPRTSAEGAAKGQQALPSSTASADERNALSLAGPRGRSSGRDNIARYAGLMPRLMGGGRREAEKVASQAEVLWKEGYRTFYLELMFAICWKSHCRSFDGAGESYDLLLGCAESVFAKEPSVPLEAQVDILWLVTAGVEDVKAADPDAWPRRRRRSAGLVFHTWGRLIESVDPDYADDDAPSCPVSPCGRVAPELIRDPAIRREYEKVIAEYLKASEHHSRQSDLHDHLRSFAELEAEPTPADFDEPGIHYIIALYSEKPHDMAELREYMRQAGLDEKTRTRVLTEIARRTPEKK